MRTGTGIPRRLGFECLEDRRVLNGTVTVSNSGGMLTITGDARSNSMLIQQVGTTEGTAIIRVTGFATKIVSAGTGKTGTSLKFYHVSSIDIDESAGGNNHVTLMNTDLVLAYGVISAKFGAGNDVYSMVNVKANLIITLLGGGNDIGSFSRVRTTDDDFLLDAGAGRDVVTLDNVQCRGSSRFLEIYVQMGPGRQDALSVVACAAANGAFMDSGGTDGVLVWKHGGNHLGAEADAGFQIVV